MHFLFHMNFRIRLLSVQILFSKNVCTSISHPTCSSLHGSDIPAMKAWVCVSSNWICVGLTGRREAVTLETVLKGNISSAASSWDACCQIPATILRGSQCPCGKAIWRCALPAPADPVNKLASTSRRHCLRAPSLPVPQLTPCGAHELSTKSPGCRSVSKSSGPLRIVVVRYKAIGNWNSDWKENNKRLRCFDWDCLERVTRSSEKNFNDHESSPLGTWFVSPFFMAFICFHNMS